MGRALFVRRNNVMNPVRVLVEFIIDRQHRPSRIPEDSGRTVQTELLDDNLRPTQLHLVPPSKLKKKPLTASAARGRLKPISLSSTTQDGAIAKNKAYYYKYIDSKQHFAPSCFFLIKW
jgi:hypothetical protein